MIELTEEQGQALQAEQGRPVDVVDPSTQRRYVLLAQELYERVRSLLDQSSAAAAEPAAPLSFEISPGILRSQQAFWRDLPELLKNKRNRGKWVCYHGNERVGMARSKRDLIRECLRRELPDDTYYISIIRPDDLAPWEDIEVEPRHPPVEEEDLPPEA